MVVKPIGDDLISNVTLLRPMVWFRRYDVLPFAFLYASIFSFASDPEWRNVSFVGIPIVLACHLLLFMMCQSSVSLKGRVGNTEVASIDECSLLLVSAAKNVGKDKVVPLLCTPIVKGSSSGESEIRICKNAFVAPRYCFEFQKVKYAYNSDKNTFISVEYPTHGSPQDFLAYKGHTSEESALLAMHRWGMNEFDIPIPAFLDLYVEHLTAPFFVFQTLCLVLWSLDDYWYYSAVTMIMLMAFEGLMCRQRQASLMSMKSMRRPPVPTLLYRGGGWVATNSNNLVPGDVIALSSSISVQDIIENEEERLARYEGQRSRGLGGNRAQQDEAETIIPCDVLLIRGSCVANEAMLTGESVPQLKESLSVADSLQADVEISDKGIDATWKRHLLFGGTALQLHSSVLPSEANLQATTTGIPHPHNDGCLGVVVRTGYGTSQGGLMRKILFATERVTGDSSETFLFIGVLVVFAAMASSVVLYYGLQDDSRNRFKLFLHCIMIVTSVVPPELPMELSLAVTNSLAALAQFAVYCTEPFRIPFAGRLDVLCFDKTGTLTKDEMLLGGVVAADSLIRGRDYIESTSEDAQEELVDPSAAPMSARMVMGVCHSLIRTAAGKDIGDPLEVTTFNSSGFTMAKEGKDKIGLLYESVEDGCKLLLQKRLPFTSALKRMSVVVCFTVTPVSGEYSKNLPSFMKMSGALLLTKGAPEVLEPLLKEVPSFYRNTYQYHMRKGKRVLAMACRQLSSAEVGRDSRAELEQKLTFIGFLIFDCEDKPDSAAVIRELRESLHRVVMITGDGALTAINVAGRLGMVGRPGAGPEEDPLPTLTLLVCADNSGSGSGSGSLVWRNAALSDDTEPHADDIAHKLDPVEARSDLEQLHEYYTMCVTGPAMTLLQKQSGSSGADGEEGNGWLSALKAIAPFVSVFARVSPAHKEDIIVALNSAGLYTLMVGDGTNDVGALKAAHVGVSIVNAPELEKHLEADLGDSSGDGGSKRKRKGGDQARSSSSLSAKERAARALREIQEVQGDPTLVKLGDASIASPFTARRTSIDSVMTVLRNGRCTLVCTVEIYKILALNCLVSAYMMSTLYLRGLKQGDIQMTAMGLVTAALFFFLSQAKPLLRLDRKRPSPSVFSKAVVWSIAGQFVVHLACLLAITYLCETAEPSLGTGGVMPDGRFRPTLLNSCIFLLSAVMQTNNFVINYRGEPFTQPISSNTMMWGAVRLVYLVLFVAASGAMEPLTDLLQLSAFPDAELRSYVLLLLIANFGLCYGVERAARTLE